MKKTVKILALALSVLLAFSVMPMTAFAADANTSESSIPITSEQEFMEMEATKSYHLTKDLDFTSIAPVTDGNSKYYVKNFEGVLDGRGFTVKGISLVGTLTVGSGVSEVGLFGSLGAVNNANSTHTYIKDLNVEADIALSDPDDDDTTNDYAEKIYVGVLAAKVKEFFSVNLENVHIDADISVEADGTVDSSIGGLVGEAYLLNATNCSFTGSISLDRAGKPSTYVGGICGRLFESTRNNPSVFRGCVNNADVSATVDTFGNYVGVGGIVGLTAIDTYVIDCVNNGKVTATATTALNTKDRAAGIVGAIWTNTVAVTALFVNCENNNSDTLYDVVAQPATRSTDTNTLRLFVYNCKAPEGNASSQNLPVYSSEMTNAEAYKYIVPLRTAADFAKVGTDALYPVDGFYIVDGEDGVIDFENTVITSNVMASFEGVLYGNGNVLANLNFDNTAAEKVNIGFIGALAATKTTAVLDLQFGTADAPVKLNNRDGVTAGVLASACDTNCANLFVCGVDVYVNATQTGYGFLGGLIGSAGSTSTIYDTNVYGRINRNIAANRAPARIGGFIATTSQPTDRWRAMSFVNCNNFADIGDEDHSVNAGSNSVFASGFVAYAVAFNAKYIGCNNFGTVSATSATSANQIGAFAGYFQLNKTVANAAVYDCANYGELMTAGSDESLGAIFGTATYMAVFSVYDFADYSSESYSLVKKGSDVVVANRVYNVTDSAALAMVNGASIRIDPDVEDAGLRFKATVSVDVLESLKEEFGENATVSYGILIAPTAFVQEAGDFTVAALDKWSATMSEQFGEDKAYVDVEAVPESWYQGEEGVFAASLNGIQDMLEIGFSGRAYIKVSVGEKTVYTLYADYSAANNSRVFTNILQAALGDVLYTNDNGATWYDDAACTEAADTAKKDPAEYTTLIGEDAGVKKYTCYTEQQYEDLTTLSENINK